MMAGIAIRGMADAKRALATLADAFPKAAVYAENAMAQDLLDAEQNQIENDTDRPTPFSVRAIRYKTAGPAKPFEPSTYGAAVYMADAFHAGSRVGPDDYLGVQILGGPMAGPRRSEKLLQQAGIIGPDQVWVPGPAVRLDAYGNVPGGMITAMLSDKAFMLNPYGVSKQSRFRLLREAGGGRAKCVLMRMGYGGVTDWIPFLFFVSRPQHQARFQFYGRAEREVRAKLPGHIEYYTDKAISKART